MSKLNKKLQKLMSMYLEKHPGKERNLADRLLVSIQTIELWKQGKNLPHKAIGAKIVFCLNLLVNEPTVDEVTSAIMCLYGALCLVDGEDFSAFPEVVREALDKFDKPELRTSLVHRLYKPELYVSNS